MSRSFIENLTTNVLRTEFNDAITAKLKSDKFKGLDIDLVIKSINTAIDFRGGSHSMADNCVARDKEKEKLLLAAGVKMVVVYEAISLSAVNHKPIEKDGVYYITLYRKGNTESSARKHAVENIKALVNVINFINNLNIDISDELIEAEFNKIYVSKSLY